MTRKITEKTCVHDDWYAEAKGMTVEALPEFVRKLTEDYSHDYGTICHAMAAAAIGAAWAVDKTPSGEITGFQAGAVMWQFIANWMGYQDQSLRLMDYADMLYPQYEYKFSKTIKKSTHDWLVQQAKKKLEDPEGAIPGVLAHWKKIAAGEVPFGYQVIED